MKTLFTILLIFTMTISAHATDLSRFVLWSGLAADFATTRIGIERYNLKEANPIMPTGRIGMAMMLGINGLVAESAAHDLREAGHPTAAKRVRWITGAFHLSLAGSNSRQIWRAR